MHHVLTIAILSGPRLWRAALAERCLRESGLAVLEASVADLIEQPAAEVAADWFLIWGGLKGHQLAEIVDRIAPCQRVVIVGQPTMDASTPLDAVVEGKVIWIEPDTSLDGLFAALQRPLEHHGLCSPQLLALVSQEVQLRQRSKPSDGNDAPCQLTSRETEIAGLVAEGLLNKQIARRLGIRIVTVKSHVHSLMRKLQVRRRGQVGRRVGRSHAVPFSHRGVLPHAR
jgi:two-component system, NarL family, nitrate/nitrite response regulator NarL